VIIVYSIFGSEQTFQKFEGKNDWSHGAACVKGGNSQKSALWVLFVVY